MKTEPRKTAPRLAPAAEEPRSAPALQPPPRSRAILGHVCNLLGVVLFFAGLHFAGEPAVKLSTTQKNVISGVSFFGGGVLTLGVGRRLLRHEEVQETSSPPDSRKIG